MNRILKTFALFLLVSTVSFVYAQDELDKSGEDKNIFISPEKSKTGTPAATEKSSNASGPNKIYARTSNLKMKKFNITHKFKVAFQILIQLRSRDFKSAANFMVYFYPSNNYLYRLMKFTLWSLNQIFNIIPKAMENTTFASDISPTSIWLADKNPIEDFPWKQK